MMRAVIVTLSLAFALPATAGKKADVDYLALAALLAGDGAYERAENALERVDAGDPDLDRARYHLVRGIIRLNRQLFSQAAEDFEASIAATEATLDDEGKALKPDGMLFVYLGQARFYAEDFKGALKALKRAGSTATAIASTFAIRAESHWRLGQRNEAWTTISTGLNRHPNYGELTRRKFFYAVEIGLYHLAAQLGTKLTAEETTSVQDAIAFARALAASGALEEAMKIAETARLKHPGSKELDRELAHIYAEAKRLRTAAGLMERVAFAGEQDAFGDAVELRRAAGQSASALALNRYVVDSALRMRQRLAILVDQGDFEAIAAMEKDLRRTRLLDEEALRYALAYAFFKTGRLEHAGELLEGLKDPELFRQAAELRSAMNRCSKSPWSC
jgi:tetratricopeptide (TPR) repeat protein